MNEPRSGGSAEALVPPRPNLGPEPWPEPARWSPDAWSALAIAGLLAWIAWRSRRKKAAIPVESGESSGLGIDPEGTPRQRLIASSEVVRGALIDAFGPTWGSKTTEEIGDDRALRDRLDPDQLARLLAFLKGADRVKFAAIEPDLPDDWEAWTAMIVSGLSAGAGLGETRP